MATKPDPSDSSTVTTRRYSSPLRERQAQQTRELILDVLTDLLDQHRADEVTTREIARVADVSERTVYRHFADREALHEGLSERLDALTDPAHRADLARLDMPGVDSIGLLQELAVGLMRGLDAHPSLARAEAVLNADPRRLASQTRSHSEQFRGVVDAVLSDLDARERNQVTAVIRLLLSSQAWLRLREEFGLSGEESGPLVAWAVGAIFNEIRLGNPPPTR